MDTLEDDDPGEAGLAATDNRADRRTILFMILYLEEEALALDMDEAAKLLGAAALAVQEQIVMCETNASYSYPPRFHS